MGAKTWMLVYSDRSPRDVLAARPALDREATTRLATKLFPDDELTPLPDVSLLDTSPPDDELYIGVFGGVTVVAAAEFGIDRPSELPSHFSTWAPSRSMYLHAMHSVVDWCAIAHWRDGVLVRALSLSPEQGVIQDLGERLPFERPFWNGAHPAVDPEEEPEGYALPFHPLEFGEAALLAWFGFVIEGHPGAAEPVLDPDTVPMMGFRRARRRTPIPAPAPPVAKVFVPPPPDLTPARPWWQFWRR
jgi:hypothetical protein